MLSVDVSEEFGLTGEYLVEYCSRYGVGYAQIEEIHMDNPVRAETLYAYKNGSISRFIAELHKATKFEDLILHMEEAFAKQWHRIGGETLNLDDIIIVDLLRKWELIYMLIIAYEQRGEDPDIYIAPASQIQYKIMETILLTNSVEQENFTVH